MHTVNELVRMIYGENTETTNEINALIEKWGKISLSQSEWVDEKDVFLITYGDGIIDDNEAPLSTLKRFADEYLRGCISAIHLLPIYPYTSDDGFSVVDYYEVDPALGSWQNVNSLSENFDIMLDAVVNHISKSSDWFKAYLAGDSEYKDYFVEVDPEDDYSSVVRPRSLPLFTCFSVNGEKKYIWTTFSDDQVDLNFRNPKTLLAILDMLIFYTRQGARYIRLDAIGFLWKEPGTSCIHLRKTHLLVQLMRAVVDITSPGVILITETNVPHKENISYFGNSDIGEKEAHMVYQFPLPPLVLYTFLSGSNNAFYNWLKELEPAPEGTAFFNFLASHDGIGVRPIEGLLTEDAQNFLFESCKKRGGALSYRNMPDGSKKVYEININYNDALSPPEASDRLRADITLAAHALLLSIPGVPAIYYHSLLGSRNDYKGLRESGINRRINREKLLYPNLVEELNEEGSFRKLVYEGMVKMISARKKCKAFLPSAEIIVEDIDSRLITFRRNNGEVSLFCCINITAEEISFCSEVGGYNILDNSIIEKGNIKLSPYEFMWMRIE